MWLLLLFANNILRYVLTLTPLFLSLWGNNHRHSVKNSLYGRGTEASRPSFSPPMKWGEQSRSLWWWLCTHSFPCCVCLQSKSQCLKVMWLLLKVPEPNRDIVQGLFTPDHTELSENQDPGKQAYFILSVPQQATLLCLHDIHSAFLFCEWGGG